MKKVLVLIAVALAVVMVPLMAVSASTPHDEDHKTTICHRTNSDTNPYVQITVDNHAIDGSKKSDHSHHTGPIWNETLKAQHIKWGDIIPPVEGVNPGQNWTEEGQAVYGDGCKFETAETTTTTQSTTTTQPTTTTTAVTKSTVVTPTTEVVLPNTVENGQRRASVAGSVEELPHTGSATSGLAMIGAGLLMIGSVFMIRSRELLGT